MAAIASIVILGALSIAWIPGFIYFAFALFFLTSASGAVLSAGQFVVLVLFAACIPGAALVAGLLMDRASAGKSHGREFSVICSAAAFYLLLDGAGFQFFERALDAVLAGSSSQLGVVALAILNSMLCTGAAMAFVMLILSAVFEFPFHLLRGTYDTRSVFPFEASRPILFLLAGTLGFELIAAFFARELWPAAILRGL